MKPDDEPWRQYFNEFSRRATRIPPDAFDRASLLYEAAHDAYETTTNQLTAAGWDEERALVIGRMFGTVVKEWVNRGAGDVDSLQSELRSHYEEWNRWA